MLGFPGRTCNEQAEHLCLRKEAEGKQQCQLQICISLSDGEGYRLLGVGLIQCTLGTHGLPLSRHKINQTQTQSASK